MTRFAASAARQRDFVTHLHQTLNDPSQRENAKVEGGMMKCGS